MTQIQPIVLCGGSGTRLWPLSRKTLPKQFVPLIGNKSLLQLTLERLRPLNVEVTCVASEEHRFLVQESIDAADVRGKQLLEPAARNTAAAMSAVALLADPEQLLLFAPADHHIPNTDRFVATIQEGIPAALAGYLVTFGVEPTFPSTAYGYIRQGEKLADPSCSGHAVAAFIEKPTAPDAEQLLLAGGNLWNAGILLVQAKVLIAALEQHAPDILETCRLATATVEIDGDFLRMDGATFGRCRSQSIDYAVLEKCDRVAVLPFQGRWSDVGSWNAVSELHDADQNGNRISGQGFVMGATDTFIYAPNRPVVALGTKDLLVVDTPDALLVVHKECAEQVKDVVALLTTQGHSQATKHRRIPRPWGAYDSIDGGDRFAVKRLTVKPGASLALRMHHHRAEHWVIVQGTARVRSDDKTVLVKENESIYIPVGAIYRLENAGKTTLEIIEVQTGGYLGEDDIVRFADPSAPAVDREKKTRLTTRGDARLGLHIAFQRKYLMNKFQKRIFVAGHRGMVGSAIVRCLVEKGYTNIVARSHAELDLTDQAQVRAFFAQEKPQEVYVAAAKVGGIHANNSYPAEFIYSNLMVEANLIHEAWRTGTDKLLFLGSSCIYPRLAAQPMAEDALLTGKLEPTNEPYAIAKIAGIKLCESYNRQYGCDFRSVMPTNLYGPGDNYHPENSHVLPAMIRRFQEAKLADAPSVVIWGTGTPRREFLYVDDMANACVHVMDLSRETYAAHTEVTTSHINVGTGEDLSIAELAQMVSEVVGYRGTIRCDASKPDGTPRKLLDVSRIKQLGWSPRTPLRAGIERAYEDYCSEELVT